MGYARSEILSLSFLEGLEGVLSRISVPAVENEGANARAGKPRREVLGALVVGPAG